MIIIVNRAYVLKALTYHIAANPPVHQKLFQELKCAVPRRNDRPRLQQLEKLPYLTATIQEGLRITHPVTHRSCREFPDKTLVYRGQSIPPGTIVHMTTLLIHENGDVFPEPQAFKPEIWLGDAQQQPSSYLVPFGRGTRSCLGINLAWAEMYLILANVFRRFDFDVSEVVRERDVDVAKDVIMGVPSPGPKGIIVKVLALQD